MRDKFKSQYKVRTHLSSPSLLLGLVVSQKRPVELEKQEGAHKPEIDVREFLQEASVALIDKLVKMDACTWARLAESKFPSRVLSNLFRDSAAKLTCSPFVCQYGRLNGGKRHERTSTR